MARELRSDELRSGMTILVGAYDADVLATDADETWTTLHLRVAVPSHQRFPLELDPFDGVTEEDEADRV